MLHKALASLTLMLGVCVLPAVAYGPKGHETVGTIADQRLAGKPIAAKIDDLLDGLTLGKAALLPDQIKSWDFKNPDTYQLPGHPALTQQLRAFLKANPAHAKAGNPAPSHHSFHFCDIPVAGKSTYASGKTGRSQFDIVQMIPFCIGVMKGTVPEDNDRKITKSLAVILLAHYLGDLHQPLHVGAQYFDQNGQPVNPDTNGAATPDQGGNSLTLVLNRPNDHGHPQTTAVFHTYWDDATVETAFGLLALDIRKTRKGTANIQIADVARRLASIEPDVWKPSPKLPVEKWAEQWANDILPLAREAHDRLSFEQIQIDPIHKVAKGLAVERPPSAPGMDDYATWSGKQVRDQLHKAGWRLAELLERIVD
jgi:hypothetical protein